MTPGAVLFHRRFVFADGASADKYLVVLAASDRHLLVAKTTSNGTHYRSDHGCQAGSFFAAFLLTRGCCCLPLSTWICFNDFYELSLTQVQSGIVDGSIRQYGMLDKELTRDVQFCAASTDDVSEEQETLIRSCFVAVK
ncbi:hypothetical protein ACSFA7_22545 [Variovorax sp. LT1R20]|uniref:hypothetical protein n=1 Tax=Variovorax sp. LT1R20 TaxID=3443729 RepID=UPI003F47E0CE